MPNLSLPELSDLIRRVQKDELETSADEVLLDLECELENLLAAVKGHQELRGVVYADR